MSPDECREQSLYFAAVAADYAARAAAVLAYAEQVGDPGPHARAMAYEARKANYAAQYVASLAETDAHVREVMRLRDDAVEYALAARSAADVALDEPEAAPD